MSLVVEKQSGGRGSTKEDILSRAKDEKANTIGFKQNEDEEEKDEMKFGKQIYGGRRKEKNWKQSGEDKEDLGETKEVLFIEVEGKVGDIWDAWKNSKLYRELIRVLVRRDFQERDITTVSRRRIGQWEKKLVVLDRQRRKGLFYSERGEKFSLCVLEKDVAVLVHF